jgi:hypothetical protein
MNIASSYGLTFFSVAPSRTGSRFDTVEVWGSSPHEPTTYLWTCLSLPVFVDPISRRFFGHVLDFVAGMKIDLYRQYCDPHRPGFARQQLGGIG